MLRGQPPWPNGPRDAEPRSAGAPPAAKDAKPDNASVWALLGVPPTATAEELKAAFRQKALATHPDHGGDPEAFRRVLRAYDEAKKRSRKPRRKTP